MGKRSTTITDVARSAGVSTATVSRVLNGGRASAAARSAVERAVAQLDYRRNDLARGLVTGKTGVVGVLIPDVIGPLYAQMARGIEDVLEPLGMHYMMVSDNRSLEQEVAAIELLLARRVDALVLVGSQLQPKRLANLLRAGPATILVQREWRGEGDDFTTVNLDNRSGVAAALDHLVELGHRRIAHVGGVRRDGIERRDCFAALAFERGLTKAPIVESDSLEEGGFQAGQRILAEHPDVTAVLCTNDRTAAGLYKAARGCRRRIPGDISVIGFDDLPWTTYLDPALTTVCQPARAMGKLAAEHIISAMSGDHVLQHISVSAALVLRDSVLDLRGPGEVTAEALKPTSDSRSVLNRRQTCGS